MLKKLISVMLVGLLCATGLVATGCPPPQIVREPVELTILHTGDLHARLDPFKPRRAEEYIGGMARIATLVNQIRAEAPNTILLDAGDTIHGTNLAHLFAGESVIAVMNRIGYDAMVVGNHDFNFGQEVLAKRAEQAGFPFLGANVQSKAGKPIPFLPPYTIVEAGGLKIGIIGLVTTDTPIMTHPKNVQGLEFLDAVTVAREIVDQIEPEVDLIVLLAHISMAVGEALIREVPGIAVLVSGNDHIERVEQIGKTILLGSGEHGKVLGRLDIVVKDGRVIDFSHEYLPITPAINEDKHVNAVIAPYREALKAALAEVVGEAEVVLDGERDDIRSRETNLGNLVADVIRKRAAADIAIQNAGGIRASIDAGPITLEEIFTVLPFDNYVVALELTGEQIWQALENGVGDISPTGAFPQVSGMSFTFDPARPCGDRIVEVTIGGEPLDLKRTYIVATNCFLAAGGDMYAMMKEARVVLETGDFLRDAVATYIRERGTVRPEVEGRIRIVKAHVTLLHTNDLHGRANPFAYPGKTGTVGGLARIATIVENVRAEGQPVFVFDAGDTLHGTGIAHYTQGQVMIKAMNAIGYDAMVVGNHESNWGADPLFAAMKTAAFPFLSANLVRVEDGTRPFAPYIIIERDGVSIGVLGLTVSLNYHRHRDAPNIRELIKHLDPVEVAQEFVPRLRQQVDVLIVLSHLGHPVDRMLAQSVKGIDIILAGHMHLVMTRPVIVGETLIVEKGWKGEYMGRLDLIIQQGGAISIRHQLIHIDDAIVPDIEVQAIIDAAYAAFPHLNQVVGQSTTDIVAPQFEPFDPVMMPFLPEPEPGSLVAEFHEDIRRGVIVFGDRRPTGAVQETVLGNVIANAIRYQAGTDIAVQRTGFIRGGVAAGNVTMDDLFTMLPFDMSVVAYNLTGTLLWQLLEASVSRWPEIYSNFLQVSGLEFTFDPTRDEGQRVTSVFINGAPLDPTRVYSVAVTHSPIGRVVGRSLREVFEQGEFVRDTGVFVRDALANYFKTHSPISPRIEGRIRLAIGEPVR